MDENILALFTEYQEFALLLSITINIIIAILGIVPSYFLTFANMIFFGLWQGMIISFAGEAIGAIITFTLYRKGFRRKATNILSKYPKIQDLVNLEGRKAFTSIFSLRLMPFIPSGIITLGAAIGKVDLWTFAVSSSFGKIPALFIEGLSVYQLIQYPFIGSILLLIIAIILLYMNLKK